MKYACRKGFPVSIVSRVWKKANCMCCQTGQWFFLKKKAFRETLSQFYFASCCRHGVSFLPLYSRNELANTNKVEGRLDPIILMCIEVALFAIAMKVHLLKAPRRWLWVGYRTVVWGTGQKWWECHDFTVTDPLTQMFWIPDGVTEISQTHFPFIWKSIFFTS